MLNEVRTIKAEQQLKSQLELVRLYMTNKPDMGITPDYTKALEYLEKVKKNDTPMIGKERIVDRLQATLMKPDIRRQS